MPEHSPAPWRVCENTGQIYDANGDLVCCDVDGQKRPHIDFPHIVRCVNLHNELVKALENAGDVLGGPLVISDYGPDKKEQQCIDKINSLLAKAKGGA